jgi:hypothetical protein
MKSRKAELSKRSEIGSKMMSKKERDTVEYPYIDDIVNESNEESPGISKVIAFIYSFRQQAE